MNQTLAVLLLKSLTKTFQNDFESVKTYLFVWNCHFVLLRYNVTMKPLSFHDIYH